MAKKANYYGFDDAKNIVEAPKIYMSSDEIALDDSAGWQAASKAQGEKSLLVMAKNAATGYPGTGTGILVSTRSTGNGEFQLYRDDSNDLYIAGKSSSGQYAGWEQIAKSTFVVATIPSRSLSNASNTVPIVGDVPFPGTKEQWVQRRYIAMARPEVGTGWFKLWATGACGFQGEGEEKRFKGTGEKHAFETVLYQGESEIGVVQTPEIYVTIFCF